MKAKNPTTATIDYAEAIKSLYPSLRHHKHASNAKKVSIRPDLYRCIGYKIARLRRDEGMTQKEFAEKVGISTSYLGRIERGASLDGLSLQIFLRISAGLEVSPDQLLHITEADIQNLHVRKNRRLNGAFVRYLFY